MPVKFDSSVCRICLQSKATHSLFDDESEILYNFTFVTLLEISESDNLPSHLCQQCNLALRVAARLKRQAVATNSELISYLKRINETFLTLPSRTKYAEEDTISDINVSELAELYVEEDNSKVIYKLAEVIIQENDKDFDCLENVKADTNHLINSEHLKYENKTDFIDANENEGYDEIEELLEETNTLDCDEIPADINKLIKFNKVSETKTDFNLTEENIYPNKNKSIVKNEILKRNVNKIRILREDENSLSRNTESDNSEDIVSYKNKGSDTNIKNINKRYKKRRYVPDVIKASSVLKGNDSPRKDKKNCFTGLINDIFRCGECDNTFTTRLNLDRHMEIHLNLRKAFSCEACGKLFTQLNSVREHMLTHTGEKPFKCDICGKAFSRRQIYKRHVVTHTKTKKYECKQCDQKFTVKRTLLLHINRIHGEGQKIEHKCYICFKSYRSKYTLSDHLQNVHNITV